MRLAMVGTRGVPARYGGFETAVEEVGSRLAERGHEVLVYCRQAGPDTYRGMRRVELSALHRRSLETLSHSFLSSIHAFRERPDVALLFNAASSPVLPVLHAAGIPVAVHVDGLEWKRSKWSGLGRKYYLAAEGLSVAWADALIADARGIASYYESKFGASTELIAYGAPVLPAADEAALTTLDLALRGYHLVVARTEPENHVDLIVDAYRASQAVLPLVIVGGVIYETDYQRRLAAAIGSDPRIRSIGTVHDQDLLNSLYAGAYTYAHGHSVGGTNPSLLRAMGAGACVLALRNVFNHEVLAGAGRLFGDARELSTLYEQMESHPAQVELSQRASRRRAKVYDWDRVAEQYEDMCLRLAAGQLRRRTPLRKALAQARQPEPATAPWVIPRNRVPEDASEESLALFRRVG